MEEFEEIQRLLLKNHITISDQFPGYVEGDYGFLSISIPYIKMKDVRLEEYTLSEYRLQGYKSIEQFIDRLKKEKFYHGEYPIVFTHIKKMIKEWMKKYNSIDHFIMIYREPLDLSEMNYPLAEIKVKDVAVTSDQIIPDALHEINHFVAMKMEFCDKLDFDINQLTGILPYKKKTKKPNSFNYKGSFDKLKSFYDRLLIPHDNNSAFIDEIEYMEFRKAFTNNEVTTKINWIGQQNELHFLIDGFSENGLFDSITQKWYLAKKCFLIRNNSFEGRQLKDSDDPPKKRYHELQSILNLLQ